jgi:hypothetical protein
MALSDEAAEKNLLVQLADRDIISHETLLERFKEIPQIENIRIKRELAKRETTGPEKAGPFHPPAPPEQKQDSPQETEPDQKDEVVEIPNVRDADGRPMFKKDDGPRKRRVDKPKSTPGVAELLVWSEDAWNKVSSVITSAYLNSKQKKNLRQLTKSQVRDLEQLKLDVFTNLEAGCNVTDDVIYTKLKSGSRIPEALKNHLNNNNINPDTMSIESYRKYAVGLFIESQIS